MNQKNQAAALAALEEAKDGLSRLPILGPAMWLYARDPVKKFMFIGDLDGTVLPPVVLDQCRLYTNNHLPYAFVTWALVNETVATRLRSAQPRIAPHEWKCGEEVWIIDAVAPFGQLDETLKDIRETVFPGRKVCALLPDPQKSGALIVREFKPMPKSMTH